jgi:hypothetical protein
MKAKQQKKHYQMKQKKRKKCRAQNKAERQEKDCKVR